MNNVNLIGRSTRDIEVKYSSSGKAFCNFNLAVQREQDREECDFISCVAFGKLAEILGRYITKGKQIALVGSIRTNSYKDKEGNTKYSTDVIVDKIDFIGNVKKE